MKINWFSPLSPAETGIAEYTSRLLPSLRKYFQVTLWTDQPNWNPDLENYADVRLYQVENPPWAEINQADINIYYIGNNPDFHEGIWRISSKCSGIVILHDFKLQDFFSEIYRKKKQDRIGYLKQIRKYYGIEAEKTGQEFWQGAISTEKMTELYPLTPLALTRSLGVITHDRKSFYSLQQDNCRLVAYLPLPYANNFSSTSDRQKNSFPPYRLIAFGYLGKNRRIESILKAFASFPLKNLFRFDIYGQLWDSDYILQQIHELGLESLVTVQGFVPEEELDRALSKADLAFNLRYPTMGEASYSQLRIWHHSLPSLVTPIGWYSELPENTVAPVRIEEEIQDIHRHLSDFLTDPEPYRVMGRNGRQVLEREHHPESYARAIIHIARQASLLRTNAIKEYLIERVAPEISYWENSAVLSYEPHSVAEAIYFISQPVSPSDPEYVNQALDFIDPETPQI